MEGEEVDKLIITKSKKFCKEFCGDNRFQYQCPLDSRWGCQGPDVPLCGFGNDSYVWMRDELTSERRLNKFEGKNGAKLSHYINTIAHSFQFKERWKDWRFGRRIRVPEYVKVIDRDAGKVYWALYDGDGMENIAQRLNRSVSDVELIVKNINIELARRNKSHRLIQVSFISLTGNEREELMEVDLPSGDLSMEDQLYFEELNSLMSQLSWQEKFVFDALVIDGLSAKAVLAALIEQGVSIKNGVAPEDTSIEDINYFYRKVKNTLKRKIERLSL